jgi:DSF synthase
LHQTLDTPLSGHQVDDPRDLPGADGSNELDILPTPCCVEREPDYKGKLVFDPREDERVHSRGFSELDLTLDHLRKTAWCRMRPKERPCFSFGLLHDLGEMQRNLKRHFSGHPLENSPFNFFVLASRLTGIFSLGGDLKLFADCIRTGNRERLAAYAFACIRTLYNNVMALDLPIITIALVQGDALGGGFESALACDVIIAERRAKFGLPEILFNLFPGMGAYSLISRRLDVAQAERMILGGRIYGAEELYAMGLVDVVADDGCGEDCVMDYIARCRRRFSAHRSVYEVRRRVNRITFEELRDITEIWIDNALALEEIDLRKMERLMSAQLRRAGACQITRS